MVDLEGHDLLPEAEIQFVREDEWWVAHHEPSGVASQGETRDEAHAMITEAVLLHRGEIGDSIDTWEEEAAALRDFGFSEEKIQTIKDQRETEPEDLPDWMQ